jgi:hypothetical protein
MQSVPGVEVRSHSPTSLVDDQARAHTCELNTLRVIRRNGDVSVWDAQKITAAITNAFLAVEGAGAADSIRIHQVTETLTGVVAESLTRRASATRLHIERHSGSSRAGIDARRTSQGGARIRLVPRIARRDSSCDLDNFTSGAASDWVRRCADAAGLGPVALEISTRVRRYRGRLGRTAARPGRARSPTASTNASCSSSRL